MMPKLVIVDGPSRGREFPLAEGENVMGRTNETVIELPSSKVSRRHAAIHLSGGAVEIEDLGSANGTFVNGKRVTRQPVPEGARITVGDFVLQVVNGNSGRSGGAKAARPVPGQPMRPGVSGKGAAMVVATPRAKGKGPPAAVAVPSDSARRMADQVVYRIGGFSWRMQVVMVVAAVALALFTAIAVIVTNNTADYKRVSLEKAQLIAQQLASQNAPYMAANQDLFVNDDVAAKQDGVKSVYVLDGQGTYVYPSTFKGTHAHVPLVEGLLKKHEGFATITGPSADGPGWVDIVAPMQFWNREKGEFRMVGVAYLIYAPDEVARKATSPGTLYVIAAGLMLAFGGGGVLLLFRTTEPKIARLQEDTELLIRGDLKQVQSFLRMKELQALAHSINRLSQRASQGGARGAEPGMPAMPQLALPMAAGPVDNAGAAATVRALCNAIPDAVLVVDADSRLMEINAAAERMFALSPSRVRGQHLLEAITDKALLNEVLDLLNEIAKSPSGVVTREASLPGKTGPVPGRVSAAGVRRGADLSGSAIVFMPAGEEAA